MAGVTTKFKTVIEVITKGFDKLGKQGSSFNNITQSAKNSTSAVDRFGSAMGIKFPKQTKKATGAIAGFGKRVGMLGNVFGKVRGVMRGLSGAISAIVGFKVISEITQLINQAQSLSNKLKVVSRDAKHLTQQFAMMGEVARNTRSDLDGTITMFQRLTFASSRLGASQEQVAQVTENVNKLMTIQGVQAHEARSVLLQLSQGFQSGKLAGDEFRAISETLPPILDILAKETGRSREELKKLASEGFLKPRLILNALLKETQNIDKQFRKTSVTLAQGMNLIKTELIMFTAKFMETQFIKDIVSVTFKAIAMTIEGLAAIINLCMGALDALYKGFKLFLSGNFTEIFERITASIMGVDFEAVKLGRSLRELEGLSTSLGMEVNDTKEAFDNLRSTMEKEITIADTNFDFLSMLKLAFGNADVEAEKVQERMKALAPIAKDTGLSFAEVHIALGDASKSFDEFQKESQKVRNMKSMAASDMFGFGGISDLQQQMIDDSTIGFAFVQNGSRTTLEAITKNNMEALGVQKDNILTSAEQVNEAFVQMAVKNKEGVQSATETAESFANAWLMNWQGNMAAFQSFTKAGFAAFQNGAATAFTSVIMGGESFGKAMKKMIVNFAKQMLMELIKVAIAMLTIKVIAGMGVNVAKIKSLSDVAKMALSGLTGAGGVNTGEGVNTNQPAEGSSRFGALGIPGLAAGGIVKSPTLAMIGEGGESEAVVPLSKANEMGFGGGMVIQNLSIFPDANLDAALLDRPQSYWVDLVQEKVLPALNELGTTGSTVTLEFQETR